MAGVRPPLEGVREWPLPPKTIRPPPPGVPGVLAGLREGVAREEPPTGVRRTDGGGGGGGDLRRPAELLRRGAPVDDPAAALDPPPPDAFLRAPRVCSF